MRTPEKSMRLYEELKDGIDRRVFRPGLQLPHEIDLAKRFSVSRNTIRASLARLEHDGLVRRIQGKGTFVAKVNRKLISVLMPCEDFLFQNTNSAEKGRLLFCGIMRAAREFDVRIETVAVSPTNDRRDIFPHCFDGITEDSLVVVLGCWFLPMFELLHSRKAKICLVDSQLLMPKYHSLTSDWEIVNLDETGAYDSCVTKLHESGAEKIALAADFVRRPGYPRLTGYLNACSRLGLPELSLLQKPEDFSQFRKNVLQFYRETGFDALIISPWEYLPEEAENINEWFGLPQDVKIVTSLRWIHFRKPPAYFDFDMIQAGCESVRILLKDDPVPKEVLIHPDFHNMEQFSAK